MSIKKYFISLLIVLLLVSMFCPLLVSCSSCGGSVTYVTSPREYQGTAPAPEPATGYYIGNASTGVFHRPDCNRIPLMNPGNKVTLHGTRDNALARGYTPCGICTP